MRILISLVLFFSYFVSLSIFNISSVTWGLQFSWFLSIIFSIVFTFILMKKTKIVITKKFKYFILYIVYFISSTIVSLVLFKYDIITTNVAIDKRELINRSIVHTVYILFNTIVTIYFYIYFQQRRNYETIIKYFIFYPSVVIMLIGVYGFLATYDIVPIDNFFHNNLSLGYTFERFKSTHRTASVFAEPSHYATYLAFLLPLYYAYFKKKFKMTRYLYRIPLIILYVSQIIMIKSLSFYLIFPILITITYYGVNEIRVKLENLFYVFFSIIIIFLVIIIFMFSRISILISQEDGSFLIRFGVFLDSINLFLSSPIIGFGYGAIRGIDSFSTLLATVGILGFIFFIYFIKKIRRDLNYLQKLIYIGFLCMFLVMLIADGMMDFLHFWLILGILLVNFNKKESSEKDIFHTRSI